MTKKIYEDTKLSRMIKIFKWFVIIGFLLTMILIGAGVGVFAAGGEWFYREIFLQVPNQPVIKPQYLQTASYYYDANGGEIYKEYYDIDRTIVEYKDLPKSLIDAIVVTEDKEFWNHSGVSPEALARAFYNNYILKNPNQQGGSTITQQLAKNVFLSPEHTYRRKLLEAVYAYRLEQLYSKEEILGFYLNTVSFGGTSYGIESASQTYFGKPTKDLNLAESAFLAGLPASPTELNPYTNFDSVTKRQREVLSTMVEANKITFLDAQTAMNEKLKINEASTQITFPHFVYYSRNFISDTLGEEVLKKGGLKVFTSIDPNVQNLAQNIITSEMPGLKDLKISNAAALITKNRTGEISAMVGSINYYDQTIDGNVNITTALRQPGSALKPFIYSLYLGQENTLTSQLADSPMTLKLGSETYTPKDYDGKFRGNVTVHRALANSLNIPAVRAIEKIGIENFATFMKDLGFDPWGAERFGPALALGSGEVRMVNMNKAYAMFPNNGQETQISPIRYILNTQNELVYFNPCLYKKEDFGDVTVKYKPQPCSTEKVSKEIAFLITSVLVDQKARNETFGARNVLNIEGVGAKTGTTNDFRDNWTFGFNQDYTVGVWVGNNDNTPMGKVVSGITGAAPIWNKIISYLTTSQNRIVLENLKPAGIISLNVCPGSNTLACGGCAQAEYYISGTEPTKHCAPPKPPEEEKEEDDDEE